MKHAGVRRRHKVSCPQTGTCKCPWQFNAEIDSGGVRRQISTSGFATQKAALEARSKYRTDFRAGRVDVVKSRLKVAEFRDEWVAARTDPHGSGKVLRETTVNGYERHIRLYLKPRLGNVRLSDLSHEHVESMYRNLRKQGQSEKNIRRIHATLRSAVTFAIKRGYIPQGQDPLTRVELQPIKERYKADPWSPEEWSDFKAHAEGTRLWPVLLLSVDSGMRRGELAGVRWSDIDLDKGRVTVRHTRTSVGRKVVAGAPKSNRSREVFLTPGTVAALKSWKKRQTEERLLLWEGWTDSGLCFTDEGGTGLGPAWLSTSFSRMCARAGVRHVRLHDLRALSAGLGLAAGESMYEVSQRLGHSSIAVTEQAYAHLVDESKRRGAALRAGVI